MKRIFKFGSVLSILFVSSAFAEDVLYTQDIENSCNVGLLGVESGDSTNEFVAQYAANVFNVAYNAGTGTGTKSTSQCVYDEACVALDSTGFSKTGYDFVNWDLSCGVGAEDCVAVSGVDVGDSIRNATSTHDATVTLTANWTPHTYNVSYTCGAGTGNVNTGHPVYSSSYVYDSGSNCSLQGYTMSNWSCTGTNGTTTHSMSENVASWDLDSDLTCVAQWTPNTIYIDWVPNNGGQTVHGSCVYDDDITLPEAPSKKGYRFVGWKLQAKSVRCADITDRDVCNAANQDGKYCYWAMNVYTSEYECKVSK